MIFRTSSRFYETGRFYVFKTRIDSYDSRSSVYIISLMNFNRECLRPLHVSASSLPTKMSHWWGRLRKQNVLALMDLTLSSCLIGENIRWSSCSYRMRVWCSIDVKWISSRVLLSMIRFTITPCTTPHAHLFICFASHWLDGARSIKKFSSV